MKNTKKGFTLVELLVVIAILAILATITIVGYTSFIQKANDSKAESEAIQIDQYIKSALVLDENVYIKKADNYYIVCTRVGNDYKVSKTKTAPIGATQITEIPQNLVNGLEYMDVGGLTYTSDKGVTKIIKPYTSVDPIPEPKPEPEIGYAEGLKFELNDDAQSYCVVELGYCTDTSIIIPSTYYGLPVTSIGGSAFLRCKFIVSIEIPNTVTSIGDSAFSECASLEIIEIPDSVTSIGDHTFSGCESLTNVEIPNSVTSIGDWAFGGCKSLVNIEIPDSVTSIGSYTFANCLLLTSIEIPDTVTSIGEGTFTNCTALTNIEITCSVTNIGSRAIQDCTSLVSITFDGTVEQWNGIEKSEVWDTNTGSYTIYCTDGEITKDGTVTYYYNLI